MSQVTVTVNEEIINVQVTVSPEEIAKEFALIAEAAALAAELSEDNAAASAAAALSSEQAADLSESNAAASAGTATTQAGIATTQAGNALTQAGNALTSANAAAVSASGALGSANTATTQAGIATTQAGIATTQAGIATTQAGNALTSANAAAASASAAAQVGTGTLLAGFTVGGNTAIAATDSILGAFSKTQGQLNARAVISGTPVAGQVAFWSGATAVAGDTRFIYGDGRLTINRASDSRVALQDNGTTTLLLQALSTSGRISGGTGDLPIEFWTGGIYRWGFIATGILQSNGAQTIRTSTGLLSFQNLGGNVTIGSAVDAGFRLDVIGTTRLNGLQTFQGTTASDTAPLGSELATTGTGAGWTGTGFATGYAHAAGPTDALTTALPAVSGTYYQLTYTVTGRTAGSFTINYGGTSTVGLTATGATGPLASSTANLEIVPTSDFNGTIVLSVRTIGTSSATTTYRDSGGTARVEIRTSNTSNTLMGLNAGRRVTTGFQNTFFGIGAGFNNTTGSNNSFFGISAGSSNTTSSNNSFFGLNAGANNTTGSNNSFFGLSAGAANTTAENNTCIGLNSGLNQTTGSNNVLIGRDSGRRIANAANLTIATNSVFIGVDSRANADSEQNQIVIGHNAIGLGSNTSVIGNSATTHGRWFGNLLIGTSTNSTFLLDVNGTARVQGSVTLTAGANIILATTTGTRIGTATNQLLSFWNKTPIAQPTTGISAATLAGSGGPTIHSGNTFGGYTLQQIAQALINIGILT